MRFFYKGKPDKADHKCKQCANDCKQNGLVKLVRCSYFKKINYALTRKRIEQKEEKPCQ